MLVRTTCPIFSYVGYVTFPQSINCRKTWSTWCSTCHKSWYFHTSSRVSMVSGYYSGLWQFWSWLLSSGRAWGAWSEYLKAKQYYFREIDCCGRRVGQWLTKIHWHWRTLTYIDHSPANFLPAKCKLSGIGIESWRSPEQHMKQRDQLQDMILEVLF